MTILLPISQCQMLSVEELQAQVRVRQELRNQMIGKLYPSILIDEIQTLREQEREREQGLRDSARDCDPQAIARIV